MSKLKIASKPPVTKSIAVPRDPDHDPGWLAASIQGRIRGIASALDPIAGSARFEEDCDGWLHEVLTEALEREADRLEKMEKAIMTLRKAEAAKKNAAPKQARTKPETIPLRDITITWPYQSPWMIEPKMKTITGEQLAGMLNIIGGRVGETPDQRQACVDILSYRLEGLSSILEAVGDSDGLVDSPDRIEPVFDTLAGYVHHLWMELRQTDGHFLEKVLEGATVTITPAAEKARA